MIFEEVELSVALLGAPNLCLRIPLDVVFLFSAWGNVLIFSTSLLSFLDSYNQLQLPIMSVIRGCSYLYVVSSNLNKNKIRLTRGTSLPKREKMSFFITFCGWGWLFSNNLAAGGPRRLATEDVVRVYLKIKC